MPNLDRNGYAPSILQSDLDTCYFWPSPYCTGDKLDRHEVFGGPLREQSKRYGLWVSICHCGCHQGGTGVHNNAARAEKLKKEAQLAAMKKYGWTEEEFREEFRTSHL